MKKILSLLALFALLGTTNAHADDIQLGEPGYGGNGCPAGSASAILSPDNKALTILFDEFYYELH